MTNFDIDKAERRTPYRVPDSFFDTLERQILSETIEAPRPVRKLQPMKRFIKVALSSAAAAVVAAAIGAGVWISRPVDQLTPETAFANLSDNDQEFLQDCYNNDRLLEAYLY